LLDPKIVLERLIDGDLLPLPMLPNEHGVYALFNHERHLKYIGVTAALKVGFENRINHRHVTGSEDRSHKFSYAYNVGRMWRGRPKHERENEADAQIAKRLRTAFVRKYCRATYVAIPPAGESYFGDLMRLESAVQAIAPQEMRAWEGKSFYRQGEPESLVDALMDELRYSRGMRDAVGRQSFIFANVVSINGA
jgi:hypothetical protein